VLPRTEQVQGNIDEAHSLSGRGGALASSSLAPPPSNTPRIGEGDFLEARTPLKALGT
jgi:hypothetical protein